MDNADRPDVLQQSLLGHVVCHISPSSSSPGGFIGVGRCPSRSNGGFLLFSQWPGGRSSSTCRLDTPPRLDNSVDNCSEKQKEKIEGLAA